MSSCDSLCGIPSSAKMLPISATALAAHLANFGVMVDAEEKVKDFILNDVPRCNSSDNTLNIPTQAKVERRIEHQTPVCRFKLQRNLTMSRGCQVWVAEPPLGYTLTTRSTVILKITTKTDTKAMVRSLREGYILKSLKHPNIITLYEIVEDEDFHVMVLEHVVGCDLYDRVGGKHFTTSDEFPYFHQITAAISYAHRMGVTHRDLKPENIVVSADGKTVKVIDFGLGFYESKDDSQNVDYEQTIPLYDKSISTEKSGFPTIPKPKKYISAEGVEKSNVTREIVDVSAGEYLFARRRREGTLCGTEAYLAPEVKRLEKDYDPYLVDMWGLGAILYFMVYRRPLFLKDERKMHLPHFHFKVENDITDVLRGLLREPTERATMGRLQYYPYWTRNSYFLKVPTIVDQVSADDWLESMGIPTSRRNFASNVTRTGFVGSAPAVSSFDGVPSAFAQQNLWENKQIASALQVQVPCPKKKGLLHRAFSRVTTKRTEKQ